MHKFKFLLITLLIASLCSFKKKKDYLFDLFGPIYEYNNSIFPHTAKETDIVRLKVEGRIPQWLEGSLLQNGPGKFEIGNQQIMHWFDGFAYITLFKFHNGEISYQSSFLKADPYLESLSTKNIRINNGFAQNFKSPQKKHLSFDGQKTKASNANVHIHILDNEAVAFGENPLPIKFDSSNLKTIGVFDFEDRLKKFNVWESAHLKCDPTDGTNYNFYIDYGRKSSYVLYKIVAGTKNRVAITKKSIDYPSYMHDFSITKNYIILTAYPLIVNAIDLINPKAGFISAHKWKPTKKTQIYIFDKFKGTLVARIPTEAMFAFHHINAFEDDQDNISLYLNSFKDPKIIMRVATSSYKKEPKATLQKLLINLKDKNVKIHTLSNEYYEFPTINPDFTGKKNDFFYAVRFDSPEMSKGFGIIKYATDTNQTKAWQKENMYAGEPLFVANPNATQEDDGIIVSTIYDANSNKSFVVILNSLTMEELARAYLPEPLPLRLHSKFITKTEEVSENVK